MKRIAVFVALKVAELAGLAAALWWCWFVGRLVAPDSMANADGRTAFYCMSGFVVIAATIGAGYLVWQAIAANWRWAGRIAKEEAE